MSKIDALILQAEKEGCYICDEQRRYSYTPAQFKSEKAMGHVDDSDDMWRLMNVEERMQWENECYLASRSANVKRAIRCTKPND